MFSIEVFLAYESSVIRVYQGLFLNVNCRDSCTIKDTTDTTIKIRKLWFIETFHLYSTDKVLYTSIRKRKNIIYYTPLQHLPSELYPTRLKNFLLFFTILKVREVWSRRACRILWRKLRERQFLEGWPFKGDILKWMFWRCDGEAWIGLMSLHIGIGFGLLWIHLYTLRLNNMQEISGQAEKLLASQGGLWPK